MWLISASQNPKISIAGVSSVTYLNAHICTLFLTMHLRTVYFSNWICLQSAEGSCKSTGVAQRPEAQIWCCIYLDFPKLPLKAHQCPYSALPWAPGLHWQHLPSAASGHYVLMLEILLKVQKGLWVLAGGGEKGKITLEKQQRSLSYWGYS